jgi:CheY-like chemotaxis protein
MVPCAAEAATLTPATEVSRGTILLIDDEAPIREVLSLALEFEGYRVFTAANGREGLQQLSSMPRPFLILLDLMMPVLDGGGFVEAIHHKPEYADIPIVAVTALGSKVPAPPVAEVVRKPVDLDRLYLIARRYGASK